MTTPPPPVKNVYLSFQGVGFHSGKVRPFEVMVGANPPTITGGYAMWQKIPRPLQRSLTIFQGYDPMEMTVEVIFGSWGDGWDTSDNAGRSVENDIAVLEWMGGSNFQSGSSPVVYVWSHSTEGGDTDLIPPQYASAAGFPWIVTGLKWGTAYRNPSGYRVWQEATIILENYLNLGAPPQPDTNTRGGYFVSKPGRDTALLIAGSPSSNSPIVDHQILAGRICEDAKNNPCKGTSIRLKRKSVYWQIKHGVHVWVPGHQIV